MMKNYKMIRRLFEQEGAVLPQHQELGMQPEQTQGEVPMDSPNMEFPAEDQLALPAPGESTVPVDPMTMTVGDFIAKCKEIDPLVCMGLESFIERNGEAFGQGAEASEPEEDITFTSTVSPEEDITFTNTVSPEGAPAPVQSFAATQQQNQLNYPA
jgi:hypothetical protein